MKIRKMDITLMILLILILMTTFPVYADQIQLNNGESFSGEIQNTNIRIRTPYAELNIQSKYLSKIDKDNRAQSEDAPEKILFIFRASENNRFSGELLSGITLVANGDQRSFSAEEILSVNFSDNKAFNDNKNVSINLKNGDFFFGNTVEDSISINTSLGSPLSIRYNNMVSIEYLKDEDIYLIRRNNSSDVKSNLKDQKIIIWPAAGEIFELKLSYLQKLVFN